MTRYVLAALAALGLASPALAQRLVGYDAGGLVHEFPSPPGGPCFAPTDPVITFPTGGTLGGCLLPGAAPPGFGDIGVDTLNDTYWVTDGAALGEYSRFGVPLSAYNGPWGALGSITGLGVDTAGGLLWATDGTFCQSFFLPATGSGCFATLTPSAVPFLCTLSGALVTDVEWDPNFGVLWFAESCGTFGLTTAGALSFPLFPMFGCGLPLGPLEGIAVDTAGVVTGSPTPLIYATDRASIAYDSQSCCPAPPTAKIYPSATCFLTPGPLQGLAYTARPNHYGNATVCIPGSVPVMNTRGQSVIGNTNFAFELTGTVPNAAPFLLYSFAPLCPGFTFTWIPGCALTLWLIPKPPIAMPVTDAFGASTLPAPLNNTLLGACIYTQIFVFSNPNADLTDAMEVIVTLP